MHLVRCCHTISVTKARSLALDGGFPYCTLFQLTYSRLANITVFSISKISDIGCAPRLDYFGHVIFLLFVCAKLIHIY